MSEVDSYGIVYHSRILEWLETVRAELMKKYYKPLSVLIKEGVKLPIIKAEIQWFKPMRLGDEVNITSLFEIRSKTTFSMKHEFSVGDFICARVRLVVVNLINDRPTRISDDFIEIFDKMSHD